MYQFEINRDEDGKPSDVFIDDGFVQTNRKFESEKDGWMLQQLKPRNFLAVQMGRETEDLIFEVNALRRENFELKRQLKQFNRIIGMSE